MALHIVFDGPPGPVPGRFVEIETPWGESVSTGVWKAQEDGTYVLILHEIPMISQAHYFKPCPLDFDTCMTCGGNVRRTAHHRSTLEAEGIK